MFRDLAVALTPDLLLFSKVEGSSQSVERRDGGVGVRGGERRQRRGSRFLV